MTVDKTAAWAELLGSSRSSASPVRQLPSLLLLPTSAVSCDGSLDLEGQASRLRIQCRPVWLILLPCSSVSS